MIVKAGYQVERRDGYWLYCEEQDRVVAEEACLALERTLQFARTRWGLKAPSDLHVVMMTGWQSYMLAAAPLVSKVSMLLVYPLWVGRVRRTWKFAGGWQNRFGRRCVVGVKPPRIIEISDRSVGRRVYVDVPDVTEKMRQIVYHEVIHACAAHLRLPAWFNEGLAMVSVDGIVSWNTVQTATLETLDRGLSLAKGRQIVKLDPDTLVAHYVRGYWITRYLDETQPNLLPDLLKTVLGRRELETRLAKACGLPPERFLAQIEGKVKAHFQANLPARD